MGLRWQDVDFGNDRLVVRQSLIAPRYKLQVSRPKSDRERVIDLDPPTVAALKAQRKQQTEERLAFGPGWDDHERAEGLVFRNADGSPVLPHLFTLAFNSQDRKSVV